MLELLEKYSFQEIIVFIVMLAFAVKGVVDFFEWLSDKNHVLYDKTKEKEVLKKQIDDLCDLQVEQNKNINDLKSTVELLIQSDKDDIKAWITEKHHYFCYEVKAIDDYSLDCIERRFENYKREHGNSFVADLMNDLRALPKISTTIQRDNTSNN